MKKLIIVLILFITTLLNARCICYYMNYYPESAQRFFKPTCEYYSEVMKKVLGEECEIVPYSNFLFLYKSYDITIIVGEGSEYGLFLTHSSDVAESPLNEKIYKWEDLANDLHGFLAIIDACFAGYIFDYPHPNIQYIITSTYKENSWNTIDEYGENVSTLSVALRCKYDHEYKCPIGNFIFGGCPFMNINECQMNLIIKAMSIWQSVDFYDWEYPSAGTCMLNGKPCSEVLK